MFERFTRGAREVVVGAQTAAHDLGHDWIGSEHLLLSVISRPEDEVAHALWDLGLTAEKVTAALREELGEHEDDATALRDLGINLEDVRRRVEERFGPGSLDRRAGSGRARRGLPSRLRRGRQRHVPFTAEGKKVLELALREALPSRSREITVGHVVLGILRGGGMATRILTRANVFPGDARRVVVELVRREAA